MEKIRQEDTSSFTAEPVTTEKIDNTETREMETCDKPDNKSNDNKALDHVIPDSCATRETSKPSDNERYETITNRRSTYIYNSGQRSQLQPAQRSSSTHVSPPVFVASIANAEGRKKKKTKMSLF